MTMDVHVFDKEYILFCDESDKYGKYFSNFYGGVIVGSHHYERITALLNAKKKELNFYGEVKWEKITERYLEKYIELVKCFFSEIIAGNLKVRIMFRHNANVAKFLSGQHYQNQYYLLYFQFIKNAFGFEFLRPDPSTAPVKIRVYVDQIGDTLERIDRFRGFIHALPRNKRFSYSRFEIPSNEITEVRSHEHVLMQCLDIVLGSMTFRLNDKNKEKLPGTRIRGKRTKAKEKVYMAILQEIRKIHKNFNVGISTGALSTIEGRWKAPYGHWSFVAKDSEYQGDLTKRGSKK